MPCIVAGFATATPAPSAVLTKPAYAVASDESYSASSNQWIVVDFPETLARNVRLSAMALMSSPSSSLAFFFSLLDSSEVGTVVWEESNDEAAGVPVTTSCLESTSSVFSPPSTIPPSPVLVGVVSADAVATSPSTSLLGAATTVAGSARSKALSNT